MKKVFVLLALLALALAGSGCDWATLCDASVWPAVRVHVFDAVTGEPIADEALAIVREPTFVDTLTIEGYDSQGRAMSLAGAWERPGVYSLTVTRPGYAMWERHNIRVPQQTCHVQTAELTAELQPVGQ